jgi:hypothetical protein
VFIDLAVASSTVQDAPSQESLVPPDQLPTGNSGGGV